MIKGLITAKTVKANVSFNDIVDIPNLALQDDLIPLASKEYVNSLFGGNIDSYFGGNIESFHSDISMIKDMADALSVVSIPSQPPVLSSGSIGQTGEIRINSSNGEHYLFVCVAPNTWKRSLLSVW